MSDSNQSLKNSALLGHVKFGGKPFGGGYPVAAVFTTRAIADLWAKSDVYFNTFGGNPLSAAAAKAVIQFAKEQNMLDQVNSVSDYLVGSLKRLAQQHELTGNIQDKGLFIGVDLVKDRASWEPAAEIARLIPDGMKAEGVLIGLTGRYGNCLKFRPPLVFREEDVDITLRAFVGFSQN